ncbi:MAG: right-handed parallel beta-helix repeat-containing protein, partial [Dehalococcoidia bacterium]
MFKSFKELIFLTILVLLAGSAWANIYVVDNTGDVDDGQLYTEGDGTNTLRKCIRLANLGDPDEIRFDIPTDDPGFNGVWWTIQPGVVTGVALPRIIDDETVIDGYTQPGALTATDVDPAEIKIELDGTHAGSRTGDDRAHYWKSSGIRINNENATAYNTVIKGLCINRFADAGVVFDGWGDLEGSAVVGCHIGTNVPGDSALGNHRSGVARNGCNWPITIGGYSPEDRNVISGNWDENIHFRVADNENNIIVGNYIGTDATGMTALTPNGTNDHASDGIRLVASLEGPTTCKILNNVISGNPRCAIFAVFDGTGWVNRCQISGNYIGLASNGNDPLPNGKGIAFKGAVVEFNTIESNHIHNNSGWAIGFHEGTHDNIVRYNSIADNHGGVVIVGDATDRNTISRNSMWLNDVLGIDIND